MLERSHTHNPGGFSEVHLAMCELLVMVLLVLEGERIYENIKRVVLIIKPLNDDLVSNSAARTQTYGIAT